MQFVYDRDPLVASAKGLAERAAMHETFRVRVRNGDLQSLLEKMETRKVREHKRTFKVRGTKEDSQGFGTKWRLLRFVSCATLCLRR